MRPLAFVLLFAVLSTAVSLAGCAADEDLAPDEVGMKAGNVFAPATLTVQAGTTVTWKNLDGVPHTATADDDRFDSGFLQRGGKWSYTFSEPGTYTYHCIPHSSKTDGEYRGMVGTIIVTEAPIILDEGEEGNGTASIASLDA